MVRLEPMIVANDCADGADGSNGSLRLWVLMIVYPSISWAFSFSLSPTPTATCLLATKIYIQCLSNTNANGQYLHGWIALPLMLTSTLGDLAEFTKTITVVYRNITQSLYILFSSRLMASLTAVSYRGTCKGIS